jgi:DNA polymerase-1
MAQSDRVILFDGSSLLYRAFFALPGNLSTASGLHTNAIYGFATSFKKILSGRTPRYGAVVFDAPGRTFRDDQYPEYKANRPRMPGELREQLAFVDRLVEANNFPMLRVIGYEADDVIGTLARRADAEGMEVYIVSADKDFAQLINERVKMLDTLKDVTYDAELVRKKWGVPPAQIVDLLALMGDKIDNVPGVPGIGAKGAAGLLEKYGSLDGILDHVDELKGRQQKSLTEHRDLALLSRDLVTLDTAVPLEQTWDDLKLAPPDPGVLNGLYKELEFYSLLSDADVASEGDIAEDARYRVLTSLDEAAEAVAALVEGDEPIAVHPIHDLPSPVAGGLVGVALTKGANEAVYLPVRGAGDALGDDAVALLKDLLEDEQRAKVFYNFKLAWELFQPFGVNVRGVAGDVQLASFLVDPTKIIPHRLEQIAKEYLQRTVRPRKAVTGSGKSEKAFSEVEVATLGEYACHLVDTVGQLWPLLEESLEEAGQRANLYEVELPLSLVLGQMELDGILVDPDDLAKLGEEFGGRLEEIAQRIYELAGRELNIASPKQLGEVLFDELKLPVIKRTKSGYSTNAEVLERLKPKHPIAAEILAHRKLAKLINTYTDVLQAAVNPETRRIHTTFQQTVGATGRLITTDPDLQRTPVKTPEGMRIRQAFVAKEGNLLVCADWSQIELRILAHFTEDEHLIESFADDLDIHRRTASQIFGVQEREVDKQQRDVGKTVNFATIYGQGATALGQQLGVPRKEAKRYIDEYFRYYAGVRAWIDETVAEAHGRGFVETILGRRRYIPELSANNFMDRQAGERIAANTPIQGSAADICKLVMLKVADSLWQEKLETRMVLQVHDELVFTAPEGEVERVKELVREHMEHAVPLRVPLVVDVGVGPTWAAAKQ